MHDLARVFPRTWLSRDFVPSDWAQVSACFDRLERELASPDTDLEAWLVAAGELYAVVSEERGRRMVAMTLHTDDPEIEKRYLEFVRDLDPKLKPRWNALNESFLRHPRRSALDPERWGVYNRSIENAVSLFRPENVPLEVQEDELDQQYNRIAGAQTAVVRGQEYTITRMEALLEEQDRGLRQEAWESIQARRLQDRESLDDLYDRLIALRAQKARNSGCRGFAEFMFRRRERFDYRPEDCLEFHRAVERAVIPHLRALDRERKDQLGVEVLRPWDLLVDPGNEPPLRPFADAAALYEGCREMFARVHPEFAEFIAAIHHRGYLDLDNRKGKAPGGYQTSFEEIRFPFIFMNATGTNRDVFTLLHEGGHAFHYLLAREDPIPRYRHAPTEFCEVASMGMELLAQRELDRFYTPLEVRRARRRHFDRVLRVFSMVATIDAFQHWVYANPEHSRAERSRAWLALLERFGGLEDWSGYETARESGWQRILHLFRVPFYFIEYGIAQIGALQLWSRWRRDPQGAVDGYRRALSLGGTRPLPDLFSAAGLRFDFSERTLGPLVEEVMEEMKSLR